MAATRKHVDRSGTKLIARNRRARHDYSVLDTVEAGVVLNGSEVKSLRRGQVQLADGFARYDRGELWLEGVHIAPYQFATGVGAHDPDRRRKLLLHRDEIDRLQDRVAQERLTLVPLSLYFRDGRAKVELALGKGRQKADKRQAIAERDSNARSSERSVAAPRSSSDCHRTCRAVPAQTAGVRATLNGAILADAPDDQIITIEGNAYFLADAVRHERLEPSPNPVPLPMER